MTTPKPPQPAKPEPLCCVRCGADLAARGIVAYLEQPNGDTVCSSECAA